MKNSILIILNRLTFLFTTLTFLPNLSSQKIWSLQYKSDLINNFGCSTIDKNGNVYIFFLSDNSYSSFLIKYDLDGVKKWEKSISSSSIQHRPISIVSDSNDYIIITGDTTGSLMGTSTGTSDIFLAKYNSNGVEEWSIQFGSTSDNYSTGLTVDSSDNIYISVSCKGNFNGHTNSGDQDAYVMKFNSAGVYQSTTPIIQTSVLDSISGLAINSVGRVVTCASSVNAINNVNTNGLYDAVVMVNAINSSTNYFTKMIGTSAQESCRGLVIDSSNDIYITGHSTDTSTYNGAHIFVTKLDGSTGNTKWFYEIGSGSYDYSFSLTLDSSNYVYITGDTTGNLDGNINFGSNDIFILKLDKNTGSKISTDQIGTSTYDKGKNIHYTLQGNLIITGTTQGDIGNKKYGLNDMFIISNSVPCKPGCNTCSGIGVQDCTSCLDGYGKSPFEKFPTNCLSLTCHQSCKKCTWVTNNDCTECNTNYFKDGGTSTNPKCSLCHLSCDGCTNSSTNCINCNYASKYYPVLNANDGKCYSVCPSGHFLNTDLKLCLPDNKSGYIFDSNTNTFTLCYQSCKDCSDVGNDTNHMCTECKDEYIKHNDSNNCYLSTNPRENYYYSDKKFKHCTDSCLGSNAANCDEESIKKQCSTCLYKDMYLTKSGCVSKCPKSTYPDAINNCKPCEVIKMFLFEDECVKNCPDNYESDIISYKCVIIPNCPENYCRNDGKCMQERIAEEGKGVSFKFNCECPGTYIGERCEQDSNY